MVVVEQCKMAHYFFYLKGGALFFMHTIQDEKTINEYENYIARHGIDRDVINAYCDASEIMLVGRKDREFGLKVSGRAKELIEQYVLEETGGTIWDLDSYCNQNKTSYDILNKYYDVLKLEAPHLFHSYLLYLEKNREESERFYSPKMKQLNKHGLIQAMQDLEDDKLDILSISMPPGTQKTTLEKFFCSWIIGKHPKDYSLFFSHSDDITRMFYDGVLDITTNYEEYTWSEIFPDVKLQSTDAKRQRINFDKQKAYSNIQCTSVGSKNAGKVRCNRYLYCDDLIGGIEEALNKRTLDKLWRIYGTDARQRKLNEQVKEIHIATRWSVHDVIGRLKQIYDGNDRARFIAIPDIDPKTGESNFDYKYNGMSVEFFHDQELGMDDISYKCLYKNEPIEREGLLYHDDDIRRFVSMPVREPDAILGICDVKNKGTDFMFLPCMYQYDSDFYLVDCICDDNTDYGVQYERLSNIIVEHNMQQCEFESNSGGDRVSYEVNKLVEEKGGRCNITDKPTETNKETRIIVNADWVKKHVLFRDKENYKPKDDYGTMMWWLMTYSVVGKNEHDDVPDGLANFALYVTKPQRVAKAEAVQNPFRTGGYGYGGF